MAALPYASRDLLQKYSQVFPNGVTDTKHRDTLIARRESMLERLDSFAFFSGLEVEPGMENLFLMNAIRIYQEPSVLYLTGLNQVGIRLLLNPHGKVKEMLFVPPKDPKKEFWEGTQFGYEKKNGTDPSKQLLTQLTGITAILPDAHFPEVLGKLVRKSKKGYCYCFYHEYPTDRKPIRSKEDHNWKFAKLVRRLARAERKNFKIKSCAPLHMELRLSLDTFQVKNTRKAVQLTSEAFSHTIREIPGLHSEQTAAATLEYHLKQRSCFGLSFPSIVASGANATILHYQKNDARWKRPCLLLLDFGTRWGSLHADITRTVPTNGIFNPLQRLVYEIVLSAMKNHEKRIRPGETIAALDKMVWEEIEEAVQNQIISAGGEVRRAYTFQPHRVSHLIGEQVHDGDPYRMYGNQPIRPGWLLSNEPGLYGHFTLRIEGKRYSEWIGVRIEDDILVTKTGCTNLSKMIPKEPDEIERCMAVSQ